MVWRLGDGGNQTNLPCCHVQARIQKFLKGTGVRRREGRGSSLFCSFFFCFVWYFFFYFSKFKGGGATPITSPQWHSCTKINIIHVIISSPESKAQVNFSDQNLSVVRRCRRRRRCCRFRRKLFTFSSYSPEPVGQFQPNLAQSILRWRGFKFVQIKGPALFQGEIIMNCENTLTKLKKSFSSEPLGQFQPNLA